MARTIDISIFLVYGIFLIHYHFLYLTGNDMENRTSFSQCTAEAINRIVAEAVRNLETTEDDELIIERARRKFLILFEEESEQYKEAYVRLLRATDPQRMAQLESDMKELSVAVDNIAGKILGGDLNEVIPDFIEKSDTTESLNKTLSDLDYLIDAEVALGKGRFPFVRKLLLKRKLKKIYRQKKQELETLE